MVWSVRAVNPAAVISSWEKAVEHGADLADGGVKMSLIQFVWLNEASGGLQPLALLEHSDLHPPLPHAWGPSGATNTSRHRRLQPRLLLTHHHPPLRPALRPGTSRLHRNTIFPRVLRAATTQSLVD